MRIERNLRMRHLKYRLTSVSLAFVVLFSALGITAVHSQEWVPCLPPWPDEVRLEAISIGENAHVKVEITFPCAGFDVDWGSVTRIDNLTFSADTKIWAWTGPSAQVITTKSHVYDLGTLSPGIYEFIFKAWGIPIKSLQFAHPPGLKATFKLETLYIVSLNLELYLEEGSKLVVKFYKWTNVYQAENVFEDVTPPENVVKFDNVPHPQNMAAEKAMLVLTSGNTENVIYTIASLTVHQGDLKDRFFDILGEWFGHPEKHDAFSAEVKDILGQWFSAPL